MIYFGIDYAALILRRAGRFAGMVAFSAVSVAVLMSLMLI